MNDVEAQPLPLSATDAERDAHYAQVLRVVDSLLEGEDDWVAAMATVSSELAHAFDYFDWTGFYRLVNAELLVIGPYQGGHGCLRIRVPDGVCGAAASSRRTQLVPDVAAFPGHIACSASTRSEIVVPIVAPSGRVLGVLDVDSDAPAAFSGVDQKWLERLCEILASRFAETDRL